MFISLLVFLSECIRCYLAYDVVIVTDDDNRGDYINYKLFWKRMEIEKIGATCFVL